MDPALDGETSSRTLLVLRTTRHAGLSVSRLRVEKSIRESLERERERESVELSLRISSRVRILGEQKVTESSPIKAAGGRRWRETETPERVILTARSYRVAAS
jgi:hypothetical protein